MAKAIEISVENVRSGDGWAFADLNLSIAGLTFIVRGIKLVTKSDGGQFVALPTVKRLKNGEPVVDPETGKPVYDEIFKVLAEKELWHRFMDKVRDEFKAKLPKTNASTSRDDDDIPF